MEFNKFENMLKELKKVYVKKPKTNQTFLEISGFPSREVVCSNILKFYLDNTEEHALGSIVLEALLKAADIYNIKNISEYTVDREYTTLKGNYMDLVIYNDEFVIGIENKIWASVYNDLQDYADTIERINHNAYKIILSIKDETQIAKQNKYINVTYSKLFKFLEPMLKEKYDSSNKWHIYLQDFIENIKRLEVEDMENKEIIQWANDNKKDIEEFYDFLSSVKRELNHKSKSLGSILEDKIDNLKLDGRVWYWNVKGNGEKEICTITVVELDNKDIAIDSKIGLDGWIISVVLRKENLNLAIRKKEMIDKLKNNNFEILNDNYNKIQIGKFDYYNDYEEIADAVTTVLKFFQQK